MRPFILFPGYAVAVMFSTGSPLQSWRRSPPQALSTRQGCTPSRRRERQLCEG
jgi:hypothetical protein